MGAVLLLVLPAPASAYRLPADLGPVPGNPADRLAALELDEPDYDHASRCVRRTPPGVAAAARWLSGNADGVTWGTYRCEKWGAGSASLHAESRAIDWHPSSRAAAADLIELLLAPDKVGNPQALARRMGVQEIIWDCSYWSAGQEQFSKYGYCFGRDGRRRKGLNATAAHLDHLHIGFTKAGARGRTSFWEQTLARR
jgi:hypothetical protein